MVGKLASTNVIESAFAIVERVCLNVKRWHSGDQRERWVGSGLLVAQKQFRKVEGHKDLPILLRELEALIPPIWLPGQSLSKLCHSWRRIDHTVVQLIGPCIESGPGVSPVGKLQLTFAVPWPVKLHPFKVICPFDCAVPGLMPENVAEALVLDPDTWAIELFDDVQL